MTAEAFDPVSKAGQAVAVDLLRRGAFAPPAETIVNADHHAAPQALRRRLFGYRQAAVLADPRRPAHPVTTEVFRRGYMFGGVDVGLFHSTDRPLILVRLLDPQGPLGHFQAPPA